jgi:hypothetical protein
MRYKLRTLLIVLAIGPPVLAGAWFGWLAYRAHQQRSKLMNVTPGFVIIEEEESNLGIEEQ